MLPVRMGFFLAAVWIEVTGDLFLWPFDFGLDLVAMGTPSSSLPLYFSLLGGERVTSRINAQFVSRFGCL